MHHDNNKLLGFDEPKLIDLINAGSFTSNLYPFILLICEERQYKDLSRLLINKIDFLPKECLLFDRACSNGSIFILEQLKTNIKLDEYISYRLSMSFLYACYYNQLDIVNFLIKNYNINVYNYNHQAIRLAGQFDNDDGTTLKKINLNKKNAIINNIFKNYYINNIKKFFEIPKKDQTRILKQLENALLVSYSLQIRRKPNE
jgi:hypothetical protein